MSRPALAMSIFLIVLVAGLLLLIAAGPPRCHGECAGGDRRCQTMCLERGFCPMENR